MSEDTRRQLQDFRDLQSTLARALSCALKISGAPRGNIQLMNWDRGYLTIQAQQGFDDEFLTFFRRVRLEDGSACARALRARQQTVVEDVMRDESFAPYRAIAQRAGFQAVQSTPIISRSGAFLGVLSTHFSKPHHPLDRTMAEINNLAASLAVAILNERAFTTPVCDQVRRSDEAVAASRELLWRIERLEQTALCPVDVLNRRR